MPVACRAEGYVGQGGGLARGLEGDREAVDADRAAVHQSCGSTVCVSGCVSLLGGCDLCSNNLCVLCPRYQNMERHLQSIRGGLNDLLGHAANLKTQRDMYRKHLNTPADMEKQLQSE